MVSTLDSESSDPSSNLGETCDLFFLFLYTCEAFPCRFGFGFAYFYMTVTGRSASTRLGA